MHERRPARSGGFTLVELMVAMTGGLFLAIVVFALSRDASRFYQRETRVANATMAGVSGFERLSSDVARAGHMTTANIQQDPHVCNVPQENWPAMLGKLRAIVVENDATTYAGTELVAAGIQPKGIVIAGALNTPEVLYTVKVVEAAGGGWDVLIDLTKPAAARLGLDPAPAKTATNLAIMQSIFMTPDGGRIVRLRWLGKDLYGVAASVSTATGEAKVTLAATPAITRVGTGGVQCGIDGLAVGLAVSVIDQVRYNIRSMTGDAGYAALFKASGLGTGGSSSGGLPYESGRAELVRVELTPAGQEIASTREIVGEYAVDLQVSAWGATAANNPLLVAVTAPLSNTYASTQLLRGLHLRLSVRSREADRDTDIASTGAGGTNNDHYRIPISNGAGGSPSYARVRTFQSDVPLRNLENSNW
jgi:hypothetical protein